MQSRVPLGPGKFHVVVLVFVVFVNFANHRQRDYKWFKITRNTIDKRATIRDKIIAKLSLASVNIRSRSSPYPTWLYQAEVVCQFTANSTGWSCLPIRFKREIFTLFIRTSKRTVTFALNKVFQTRSAVLNDEYLLRDIAIVEYLILVSYKVCYGITFNAAHYLSLP